MREDAPFSCMGGACGTCRAKLLEGDVEMEHNFALSQDDLDQGPLRDSAYVYGPRAPRTVLVSLRVGR